MGIRKDHVQAMYAAAKANQELAKKNGWKANKETDAAYDRWKVLEMDATPEELEAFYSIWK